MSVGILGLTESQFVAQAKHLDLTPAAAARGWRNHPDIHGVLCIDATLQTDRDQGGLELLTRLQWRGEPGSDETLVQLRDAVAALVPLGQGLSLRANAATPELVAA